MISMASWAMRATTSSAFLDRCITCARSKPCSEQCIGVLPPAEELVFNEYTGDSYTILDDRKVNAINQLLATLDPVFLNPERPRYVNPTLDAMLTGDPSEGVRAALILPFLRHRFEIEVLRPFGGAILHMLYRCLDHKKMTDGSPESESIMRLLIEIDRMLYEDAGYLPSDFHVGICRKR